MPPAPAGPSARGGEGGRLLLLMAPEIVSPDIDSMAFRDFNTMAPGRHCEVPVTKRLSVCRGWCGRTRPAGRLRPLRALARSLAAASIRSRPLAVPVPLLTQPPARPSGCSGSHSLICLFTVSSTETERASAVCLAPCPGRPR